MMLACLVAVGCGEADSPHKVYVALGFHANFYHSWRGDTPDEAGFGTDIRVVRAILDMLEQAEAQGLDARGYWDSENLFTLEEILPAHAPDIIERIRARVEAGRDEILLMPYDNGLIHAMTPRELRANLRWAIHNPWGSGVRDLYGSFTPILRPQEMTLTTGALPILEEEGVEGLVLLYAGVPFNAISTFVPALPPEQRYGATWLRLREDGPRILLLPAASIGDVVDHVSLEKWILDLRRLQTSGQVDGDLLLHINADADGDFWLPQDIPRFVPNSGGLREYIEAVNKYPWAEFTTPARYLADHEPRGEVLVRQDLADGGFDGQYSWAEKFASHSIWTALDQSRLASDRAEAWQRDAPEAVQRRARDLLWEGRESAFFQRVIGLSTTHFGMSTPIVNEERQAVAERVTARARDRSREAERLLADSVTRPAQRADSGPLYSFLVRDLRPPGEGPLARSLLRLPLIFSDEPPPVSLVSDNMPGLHLPHSLVNREPLSGGRVATELWTRLSLRPGETRILELLRDTEAAPSPDGSSVEAPAQLVGDGIALALDDASGVASLSAGDWQAGGDDFLSAFVTYRVGDTPRSFSNGRWQREAPPGERLDGLQRARLRTQVAFPTPEDGEVAADLTVTLSLPDAVPWVVADVEVAYPYTTKRDALHDAVQKLRRFLDLRWVEVAPFELRPRLEGTRDAPLRVWKHNYLGVTSAYDLDYARINPRNAELDAFNHQVTAGWLSVSDRRHGLLVATAGDVRSSFAFAPMRLRERDGRQDLRLNPFGSYHGRQLDYSHLDGTGLGAQVTEVFSSSLRPNGPSYNGERERFSLLLAPYVGDAPPADLQADAAAFFAPPAVIYARVPPDLGADVRLPHEARAWVEAGRRELARRAGGVLPRPRAFLANPTAGAIDVVWDPPDDPRVDGFELAWRTPDRATWETLRTGPVRRHRLAGVPDGHELAIRVRTLGAGEPSPWTETTRVTVGPIEMVNLRTELGEMSLGLLLRLAGATLQHLWATR
jgi:hypothetical protein